MKICYIANASSQHTWKWANYFISRGDDVHIISHEPYDLKGATVHYINFSLKEFFKYKKIVHRKIDEIAPDVLHAHQFNDCGLYGVTYKQLPAIVSAWGSDILLTPQKNWIMKSLVKYIIKNSSVITSDTLEVTRKIVEFGGNKDNIYTFPMGIESEILQYKNSIDITNEGLTILSNRRLEKLYNVDIIIKGFKLAVNEYPNLNLIIAATGVEESYLKKLTIELDLDSKIEFTGRYNQEELGSILKKSDVFISIPSSDGTSVSLLEAMGCGLYPILCDLPANREWIKNNKNGIIINNINENNVKDAILKCATNKSYLEKQSKVNINIIKEKALWKNNIKVVEEIYKRIGGSVE
ncbi:glycosyltransferase family 4 protein [Clostridium gasigenes]|uniref:Glycosyltransferase family 4 protein n=1 Tax=Clostridium gasigenes TaxID=94869 RepID=A0A7X0S9M3_9CLOT|nr:glycosyltransferase family 4 protein [Clostridium gasigenes]MBB6713544.1 glycosyltransferase family 4 protein [Clostridium gasigenes]